LQESAFAAGGETTILIEEVNGMQPGHRACSLPRPCACLSESGRSSEQQKQE
jgi:hypothetical protein